MLFTLCRKFFSEEHEALEVLNDGMLKVFKNISTFQDKGGSFFNWVYTIVRNTALDKVRLARRPEHVELTETIEPSSAFAESPLDLIEKKDLILLFNQLPPATRKICRMFYMDGFPIAAIASLMQLSEGTVKWHLSESRKKLQPILKKHYFKKS